MVKAFWEPRDGFLDSLLPGLDMLLCVGRLLKAEESCLEVEAVHAAGKLRATCEGCKELHQARFRITSQEIFTATLPANLRTSGCYEANVAVKDFWQPTRARSTPVAMTGAGSALILGTEAVGLLGFGPSVMVEAGRGIKGCSCLD